MIPQGLETLLTAVAALGLGCLAVYLLSRPFRWVLKWLLNGICGVIVLFLLSAFGSGFGLEIPFNAVTVLISAMLGLPGVALILLRMLLI